MDYLAEVGICPGAGVWKQEGQCCLYSLQVLDDSPTHFQKLDSHMDFESLLPIVKEQTKLFPQFADAVKYSVFMYEQGVSNFSGLVNVGEIKL